MHVGGEEGDRMAKSGGMLNAICAKLQKPTTDGTVMDDDGEMRYKDESICMMDTDTDKENNNQPQVDNQNCYTQDSQVDNDRGRKSRRKNLKPRNIAQLKEFRDEYSYDELEEYEVIGKDVEYDCIYERDNRNGCILDLSRNSNTEDSEEARADDGSLDGSSESYHVDNSGALDLTVDRGQGHGDPGQGQTPSTSHINYASDSNHDSNNDSENDELVTNGNGLYKGESFFTDEEDDDADNQNNQVNADDEDDDNDESAQNLANGDNKQESVMSSNEMTSSAVTPSEPPADAAAIKDYAQSTVNELLSMYGLSDDKESITESVPIQNFSSGKILQRHGVIPLPRQVPRLWPSVSPSPSMSSSSALKMLPVSQAIPVPKVAPKPAHQGLLPLTTNATPMSTPSIYNLAHQSPQLPTPSPRPTHPNEGIYAKFVESVSKIASITPGGAGLGTPPALIPDQMRHLLAAHAHGGGVSGITSSSSKAPPYLLPGAPSITLNGNPSHLHSPALMQTLMQGQKNPAASKFAQSAEYIKACFNPDLAPKLAAAVSNTLPGKTSLPDYTKYMKRYVSSHECGREQCRNMAYREHFHCLDCQFKVFVKKEEMIRHFKWHKKRDESLQHGFMRYSPLDDCSKQFDACTHNGKQTHYHCIQTGCNKVYISTSDVQMHANYHRKDSAIIQEGFQRFRATEDCGTPTCSFYGQRTTHFHCRRNDCIFTFKNKADMEKHKTYHQKDEVLRRDGFKKFMKYEHCIHQGTCKYSKVANHIHCIRPGCDYVLHSTGQLYSHKRKHERQEFESAYRQFKDNHKGLKSSHTSPSSSSLDNHSGMSTPTLGNIGGSFVFTPRSSISPVNSSWKTTQSGISSVNLSPASAASVVSPITPSSQSVLSSTGGVMGNTSVSAPYSSTPKNYQMISPSAAAAAAVVAQMKQQTNSASPSFSSANDTLQTSQSTSEGIFSVLPSSSSALSLPAPSVSTIAPQLMLTQQPSVINIVPKRHEAEYIDLEDLSRMHRSRSTSPAAPATDLTSPPAALANAMVMTTPSQMVEVKSEQEESLSTKPLPSTLAKLASKLNGADLDDSLTLPIPPTDLDEKPFDGSHSTVDADEKDEMGGMGSKMHLSTPSAHGGIASDIRFVPKTSPAVNSKKEKDESWKKYLTRYTANDPCHPHCEFLYKDHYHCNKGCGMIFKSKDGVREHARYHMQQDCISPISYSAYDSNTACTDEMCVHRCKNHHYHCIWPECRVVITDKDPSFARLEHHKIHEYARAASAKIPHQFMHQYKLSPEGLKRRRGRPPKFPKDDVTIVPKVEMTDEEIATTLLHDHTGAHHTLRSGFKKFHIGQACPDDKCMYQMQEHYHCVRPRCHHSTDRPDVLNLHAKDFHSYIVILPGFEFFDRNVNCRRQHCHNRRVNKHFHCMQPRCDYSFVRYSTMAQHDKKHKFAQLATLGSQNMALALQPTGFKAMPQQTSRALAMMMSSAPAGITSTSHLTLQPEQSIHHLSNSSDIDSVVKTKGIYFPVSSAPGDHNGNLTANDTGLTSKMLSSDKSRVTSSGFGMSLPTTVSAAMDLTKFGQFDESEKVSDGYLAPTMATPIVITPTTPPPTSMSNAYNVNKSRMVNIAPKMSPGIATEATSSPEMPLTMLLQQKSQAVVPQLDWLTMKMKMHFGMHQNCGRPFCKLKKKDHFHCFDCNQAFSDSCRLKSHITRHGLKLDKSNYVHGVRLAAVTNGLNSNNTSAGQGMVESGDASPVNSDSDWSKDEVAEREDAGEFNPSSSLNLNAATFSNMLRGNQALSNNPATPTTAPEVMDLSVGIAYPTETGDAEYEESEPSEGCDDGEGSGEMVEEGVDEGGMIPDDATSQEEQMMPQIDSNSLNTPENDLKDDNNAIVDDVDRVSFSRHSGRKRVATRHDDFVDSDVVVAKQRRTSSPRPANDENVPEGYEKFAFVDDCRAERCAYRLNASHYHCIRPDCRFSFSDRTRAPQHTQRHERVDSVMGDEFQQHRIHLDCEKAGCEFSRKATHFHCLRCEFACTDLAKVPLHRKQHSKMDAVDAFGFEKVSSSEECHHEGCAYSNRQTHYHCTQNACAQIMLTPAQMRPHQLTHESG